ncbi:MAG: GNAT family N-acetyltransferase [Burkholderiales bacterium]|nr:GNAT family N-acetyltransferase [Burkholderiales bacterium]
MRLRRLDASDLAAFQAYRNDPELGRWQGWTAQPDAQALAFLNDMAAVSLFRPGQWTQLGIADELTGQLLGDLGVYISSDGHEAEFGFTLARAAQGRGIAGAAVCEAVALVFDQTAVQRIHAQTDDRNAACIRLLERLNARLIERIATEFRGEPCVERRYELARRPG